jgi:hypothetical protein
LLDVGASVGLAPDEVDALAAPPPPPDDRRMLRASTWVPEMNTAKPMASGAP